MEAYRFKTADAVTAVAVPGPKAKITFPIFMNGTAA